MDITQKCYHKPSEKARAFNDFSQVFSGFQSKNPFWPKTGNLLMNTPPKIKPSGFWADWGRRFIRRPLGRLERAGVFFPYKMKITPAPKRLVAQRRRREGACCPKGHRQPSSRSKRDLLGRRSGDGAAKECPILNWVFREQRSPPRRGFPKG